MKRAYLTLFLLAFSASTAHLSGLCCDPEPVCCEQESDCCSIQNDCCAPPPKRFVSQLGVALEERPNFNDVFLVFNQTIDKHWFYELRLVGFYNLIVNNPPTGTTDPAPHPIVKDERNQWGIGCVAIAGYIFDLTEKVSFMPFLRYECKTNAAFTYRDKFHNQVNSNTNVYYLGGRITMKVTDDFRMYFQYFGGYFRNTFHGKGFFAETSPAVVPPAVPPKRPRKHVHFQGLTGTFELGFPYKFSFCNDWCIGKTWVLTPYIQFVISDNNISYINTVRPYSLNPLTTSNVVYAFRICTEF